MLTVADPVTLDLLAKHLQAIRNELRESKYNADNDRRNVRSFFENLAATNASQLGDIEAKLAARIDSVETLLGERFEYLDERIGSLDERISRLDERIGSLDARMTSLETHVARNADRVEHLIGRVEQLLQSR
jgi:uncharacterized coiled-coil protein SlyX